MWTKAELEKIIAEDPFYQNNLAEYQIIEFNPVLHSVDDSKIEVWEHCLSLSGYRGKVQRYNRIRYWGFSIDGTRIERTAEGVHAILVQHEIDHLDGILFKDRVADPKHDYGLITSFEAQFGKDHHKNTRILPDGS